MTSVVAHLVACWRADPNAASCLRPGATIEQLASFERRYGVALPPALRDLYGETDGSEGMIDDLLIGLAPLAEVAPLRHWGEADPETPGSDLPAWAARWFVFADYLIESHHFLVRLDADPDNPGPVVAWAVGRDPIAPTFTAFLELWEAGEIRALLPGLSDPLPDDAP